MIKKIILLFVLCWSIQFSFSQSELDSYKYVIVPTSYDFCKEPDQYQLNSLSKFLFEKQGFKVLMSDDAIPQDLINNGCLALYADVIKEPGMFVTKLKIELKDCQKQLVYTSRIGKSREKKYQVAYNIALRQAFESFDTLNYSYNLKISEQKAVSANTEKSTAIAPSVIGVAQSDSKSNGADMDQPLTARKIDVINYELLNSKGEVVFKLIFSGKEEFYMVEGMQATVYKLNDKWVIAKTIADGSLQVQTLNVTF